jgi:hypothetical protein
MLAIPAQFGLFFGLTGKSGWLDHDVLGESRGSAIPKPDRTALYTVPPDHVVLGRSQGSAVLQSDQTALYIVPLHEPEFLRRTFI